MMKIKILICFLILYSSELLSQSKVYTGIQENSKIYPGKNFNISKVIDIRKDKTHIGIVHKTDFGEEHMADFKKPLPEEFIGFLNKTFPKSTSLAKVILVINQFEIGDVITGKRKDTGFVKVDFDFYKVDHDSAFYIYNYTNTIKDVGDNIPLTHSNRIKRIILLSVSKLDSLILLPRTNRLLNDSLVRRGYTLNKLEQNDSLIKANNFPAKNMTLIMGHGIVGGVAYIYGANLSFMWQLKKHPRYLLGGHLNYSFILFKDVSLPPNTTYAIFTSDFGFRVLKQIKNITFFNSSAHIMIGQETYTSLKPTLNTN